LSALSATYDSVAVYHSLKKGLHIGNAALARLPRREAGVFQLPAIETQPCGSGRAADIVSLRTLVDFRLAFYHPALYSGTTSARKADYVLQIGKPGQGGFHEPLCQKQLDAIREVSMPLTAF
jgi:hypothetical protein